MASCCFISKCYMAKCYLDQLLHGEMLYGEMLLSLIESQKMFNVHSPIFQDVVNRLKTSRFENCIMLKFAFIKL